MRGAVEMPRKIRTRLKPVASKLRTVSGLSTALQQRDETLFTADFREGPSANAFGDWAVSKRRGRGPARPKPVTAGLLDTKSNPDTPQKYFP